MCHIKLPVYYSFHLDERWRHRAMVKVAKTLRSLGDHLQVGASVRNVYGDPVNIGGRTVIPIARVSYGFGAGGRVGGNGDAELERGRSGGGAGMTARPVGALEITEAGTRFIPFIDPARLGMALIVGFLIGLTISRGHSRRRSVIHKTLGNHGRDDGALDLKTSAPSA
jgi:uncharacterized spore protein YtfJ